MSRLTLKVILPLGVVSLCWGISFAQSDVSAIARAVDAHYNHIRTLEADFTEIYSGAGTERTESGTLQLKKPGKMRWEYRSPREKLFLSDGKQAWFYVPGEKQARKVSIKQLDDLRTPLAFLLGKSQLQEVIKGLALDLSDKPAAAGNTLLRGVPGGMENRLTGVRLEISPTRQITRVVLEGIDGSVTEYRLENQKENIAVPDSQFRFTPPLGVEMVEDDFGQ